MTTQDRKKIKMAKTLLLSHQKLMEISNNYIHKIHLNKF